MIYHYKTYVLNICAEIKIIIIVHVGNSSNLSDKIPLASSKPVSPSPPAPKGTIKLVKAKLSGSLSTSSGSNPVSGQSLQSTSAVTAVSENTPTPIILTATKNDEPNNDSSLSLLEQLPLSPLTPSNTESGTDN